MRDFGALRRMLRARGFYARARGTQPGGFFRGELGDLQDVLRADAKKTREERHAEIMNKSKAYKFHR